MSAPAATRPMPSEAVRAEAAAWLARLRGPNRTPEAEKGFRRWLAMSSEHQSAFEMAMDYWDKSARLRRRPLEQAASWEKHGLRIRFAQAAAVLAAVAVLAVLGTVYYGRDGAVATAVGEQRTLTLEDGSRVTLNTATRVRVRYDDTMRRIELEAGEALFDVATRSNWPFVVVAGERQIRALGTAFMVRRDARRLSVTLVEGKVAVVPATASEVTEAGEEQGSEAPIVTLQPGQRLTFATDDAPRIDTPVLAKVTAWQQGQVALDDMPLAEAIAEMNRYSRIKLDIERPEAAALRISGLFRAGDSAEFAQAVAGTYQLQVIDRPGEIVLAGLPRMPLPDVAGED